MGGTQGGQPTVLTWRISITGLCFPICLVELITVKQVSPKDVCESRGQADRWISSWIPVLQIDVSLALKSHGMSLAAGIMLWSRHKDRLLYHFCSPTTNELVPCYHFTQQSIQCGLRYFYCCNKTTHNKTHNIPPVNLSSRRAAYIPVGPCTLHFADPGDNCQWNHRRKSMPLIIWQISCLWFTVPIFLDL